MKHPKISYLLCILVAVLAFLFLRTSGSEAAPSSHPVVSKKTATSSPRRFIKVWHIVSSPNVGSGDNHLNGVAAVSASDIWAVGYSTADSNSPTLALMEHWDGTQWSVIAIPEPVGWYSDLTGITAISSSDVWAVGSFISGTTTVTLIEHWDGTQWSIVSGINPGGYSNILAGIAANSSSDVWAVGSFAANSSSASSTLTEHWDGTQWSVVPSPNVGSSYNSLRSVSAHATNDVWAAGAGNGGLVEHWDGTQWSIVLNAGYNFTGLTALGSRDVWVVGYQLVNGNQQAMLEHWNGVSWKSVASPNPGGLSEFLGVTAISTRNIWAVGYTAPHTLIEHGNDTSWNIVASPDGGSQGNFLLGTTHVPGTKQVLAVGYYYVPNGNPESVGTAQTLVEVYP